MERRQNRVWALSYSLTSIRNRPIRSVGIALLLAIGIALPTTVFAWGATSEFIAVESYFLDNSYQMLIRPSEDASYGAELLNEAAEYLRASSFVESSDVYVSSVAIVTGEDIPDWWYYNPNLPVDNESIQDTRIIPTSNYLLSKFKSEFNWIGNDTLSSNSVLVSKLFVDHCALSLGLELEIGDIINFDVILRSTSRQFLQLNTTFPSYQLENYTISGIYDAEYHSSFIGEAFPSRMRMNLWTRHPEDRWPVLGIADSILVLEDDIDPEFLQDMETEGIFEPVMLVQADFRALIDAGTENIEEHITSLRTLLLERYPDLTIRALRELEDLSEYVGSYMRGQVFSILGIPIILMSLFLTVFTSKSSVTRRSSEVSILRSKGASYNQILSSIVWEAVMLGLIGLVFGFILTAILVPIMGASIGDFLIDPTIFLLYFTRLRIPPIGYIIAGMIAFYLPGLYMYHVNSNVKVYEIGQPIQKEIPSEIEEVRLWKFTGGFVVLIAIILALPAASTPAGYLATAEVLAVSLILFAASYLGSQMMQQIVSKLSNSALPFLGERYLYVTQSLKRRRGQFIPLLVILTLTLSTTTMMLIESATVDATAQNELEYAYGADLRIVATAAAHYHDFNDELELYDWIVDSTAVLEKATRIGNLPLRLEGIQPLEYLNICRIESNSFNYGDAIETLYDLAQNRDGIVLSEYLATLLNRSIGDRIGLPVMQNEVESINTFEIVGIMKSAPAFGYAAESEGDPTSLPFQLGLQVRGGGFAFVNQRFLRHISNSTNARYFLAEAVIDPALTDFAEALEDRYAVEVATFHYNSLFGEFNDAGLFLTGLHGFTTIGIIMCVAMALSSIGLFFGSAVMERKPEYAILRALGATTKQVSGMVLGEFAGLIVATISLSLFMGFAFGYLMSILIFTISPFQALLPYVQSIHIVLILSIAGLEALVMLIACLYPARSAGSTNMIEELRNL
ncbi:MAG: ABC transporter permease [Candidatus Thorarchaeota archaeon]|jgi:ABC-type antimicrobial peptide transport system permease subunit